MESNGFKNHDEVSLGEVFERVRKLSRYLAGKWLIIVTCISIGGGIGFTYSLFRKPLYTAEYTFVLEEEGKGGLGQYAGLAAMVGVDLGGGSSGLFQGENIIELYKSRSMIEKTLLCEVDFNGRSQKLINRYIEFNNLAAKWSNVTADDLNFRLPLTITKDSIISVVADRITKENLLVRKPDKKLSIFSVQVTSADELFSKAFANKIVDNVNSFYVLTRTKKTFQNVQILEKQADSVRKVLNAAIGGVASSIDANPNANPALQILRTPSQRKQIDVQASSAVYAELVKNLELSRITLRKETPLIQAIDVPILPLKKDILSKGAGFIWGAAIFGLLIISGLSLRLFFLRIFRNG